METVHSPSHEPEIHIHLRWVASFALCVGVIATGGLILTLFVLTDSSGTTYGELINSNSLVQSYLWPTLLISGCLLVAFTAVCTWLITLYSSFRIAGPLFRFSRNLETSIAIGSHKPIPIRDSDLLQKDAELLASTLVAVDAHYTNLRDEVALAIKQTRSGEVDQAQLQVIAAKLKRLVERVHV